LNYFFIEICGFQLDFSNNVRIDVLFYLKSKLFFKQKYSH